jgi:hypothetical protein
VLRSVCAMTPQFPPAPGREDNGFPRPWSGSNSTLTAHRGNDLGVRAGDSDPGRMLAGVLLLVATTIILALALAWWLV